MRCAGSHMLMEDLDVVFAHEGVSVDVWLKFSYMQNLFAAAYDCPHFCPCDDADWTVSGVHARPDVETHCRVC